jgi:hypothetical protein
MKPYRTSSRRLLPPSSAWLTCPHTHETSRALIVHRYDDSHGPSSAEVVGERGREVGHRG